MVYGSKMHLLPHQQFTHRLLEEENARMNREDYVTISMPRFKYAISFCKKLKPAPETSVLDVGRSYLSFMLSKSYKKIPKTYNQLKEERLYEQEPPLLEVEPEPIPEPVPPEEPTVGGKVHMVNKITILLPWVVLALAVTVACIYMVRRRALDVK